MARDKDKEYVVTGAYVTMTTMTNQGMRVMGYFPGALVPPIPVEQFDHLLANGLIAAVGDEPQFSVGPTPESVAQQSRDEEASARMAMAEAQARLDNAAAQRAAAEDAVKAERERAKSRAADEDAAAKRVADRAAAAETDAQQRSGPARRAAAQKQQ